MVIRFAVTGEFYGTDRISGDDRAISVRKSHR